MKQLFHTLLLAGIFLLPAASAQAQNVGIGTTAPTQALDVNGNLRIRGLSGSGVRLPQILPDGTLQVSGPVPATATLTQPAPLGTVATGRAPAGVTIAGAYAYVSNQGDNTIQVFSLANPAQPVSVGTVPTTITTPDALLATGGYLYVTSNQSTGFQIFSLSNPSVPASVAVLTMPGGTDGVAVLGNTLYVANVSNNTLMVYDISNPVAPVSVGSVAAPGPGQLAVAGGYLYVASYSLPAVQTFSLAVPTAPASQGTVPVNGSANGAAVVAGRLYITNQNNNTLQGYSLAAPATPASAGTQPVGGQPYAVDGTGNYLYVANIGANNLQILQLSVPTVVAFDSGGALTSVPATSLGDNLGNHTATTTLALNGNWLANQPGTNTGLRLDNTGNVGIGTATPGARLSLSPTTVEPKITLWDGGSTTSHYGFGISSNQLNYHVGGNLDNHVFYAGGKNGVGVGATELLRIKGDGNVGIGKSSPTASLHVARGTGGSGTAAFEGTNRTSHFNYSTNENTYIRGGKPTSSVLLNDTGGNVGVGTSTPSYPLDVNGTIHATTSQGVVLDAQDRPIITRGWDPFTSGNYQGLGRWGMFMEPYRLTFGVPSMAGRHFQWVTYDLASQVDKTLMTLTQSGQLGVGTNAPVGRLHLVNDGGGSGVLDDVLLQSYGTTGPGISLQSAHGSVAAPLDLNNGDFLGDIGFTGQWNGSINSSFNAAGIRGFYRGDGTTGLTELRLRTSSTDRMVISAAGNVGIATATPETKLSISPGTTEPKITLWDGGNTTAHYGFGISHAQLNYHVQAATDDHVFYVGGKNGPEAGVSTELMRVKGNGNVGIGTGNPTEKLELNGVMKFSTNDTDKIYFTSFGGANGSKLAHSGGWSLDYYAGPGNSSTAGYHRFFTTDANAWAERLRIAPNGNVGIGQTNPLATLQVARGTGVNGTAAFEGTNRGSNFNYSTNENTYIRGGKPTSDVILNDNGGGVAIGTTTVTAGELLEVNGSTRTTEVHTPATGTANMLALAYCQAGGASGTMYGSSSNVSLQRLAVGHYRLTISGQSASLDSEALLATLYGNSPGFISTLATGPAGTVDVFTFNTAGAATDRIFHFSLFKR